MPKKKKNNIRFYTNKVSYKPTNLKLVNSLSTLMKVNHNPFKYRLALKYKLPGYATNEYEISYQFRKNDKYLY